MSGGEGEEGSRRERGRVRVGRFRPPRDTVLKTVSRGATPFPVLGAEVTWRSVSGLCKCAGMQGVR